jgi:hypothetical protein
MSAISRVGIPACIIALFALASPACFLEGGVEIRFLWPEDSALAPAGEQISEVTLVRSAPGEPVTRTTRRMGNGGQLDMGTIEAGQGLHLAVELRSSTQGLLGYGRASQLIDLEPGDSIEVSMHVRRPFVYVTGHQDVTTFDPTAVAIGAEYRGTIEVVPDAVVAAPTPDGTTLILGTPAVNGGNLYLVSTSDYGRPILATIGLRQAPVDLAVSPSGRYAVVAHDGASGGVTVVDLQAPDGFHPFVGLGSVERVVVGAVTPGSPQERAYALINQDFECQSPTGSRVTIVDLDDPRENGPSTPFETPVQDIAASPDLPFAVVANACTGMLERVEPGAATARADLAAVPGVTTVAIMDGRIWSAGSLLPEPGKGARLLLSSMDADGNGAISRELPLFQERAVAPVFSREGEEALRQIDADAIYAVDMAVLPGADAIALITHGSFLASEITARVDINNPDSPVYTVLPQLEIDNHEYVLIDTATATAVQRWRTACSLTPTWTGVYILVDEWECWQDPDFSGDEYLPTSLSALYGTR